MFTDYIFPEAFTKQVGLKQATLRNLKSLVVLAGPNGAGKSRYLALVPNITERIPKSMKGLEARRQQLAQLAEEPNNLLVPDRKARMAELEEEIQSLESIVTTTRWTGEHPQGQKTIPLRYTLAPKGLSNSWEQGYHIVEVEPDEVPLRKLEEQAYNNLQGGFSSAASSVPAYFHMVARAMYDSEHPLQKNSAAVKLRLDDALAFNRVLSAFFSAEIELKLDGRGNPVPYFRGRPFQPGELSEGEQILVIWAIILHRQRAWLRGAQVLIDEPENHLHPDACIRALNALQSEDILGPEGQIWLATHSIPLIAYAGLDSVYLVDHGAIEYAGNKIEKVVERLMGGAEGSTRLRTLLADADELAFDAFAAQCLLPPDVAPPRKGDDQQAQMAKLAQQVGAHKENVRILDYAAGRGRLAVALKEAGLTAGRKFTYLAYQDPAYTSAEEQRECLARIRELEQPDPPESCLITRLDQLTVPGKALLDLVVMCNVLHEIPVRQWLGCFSRIQEVLANDGQLVILEDQLPQVGELPHANGYVILDEIALMELFGSQDAVRRLSVEREERLTAFGIPKPFLRNASAETICKALEKVKRKAKDELRLLRETSQGTRSFQAGRRHAHYALLHTNAQLALEEYEMA